jgi:hypothetical protein
MAHSEELIGTAERVTLFTRCRLNRCHYNWVLLCLVSGLNVTNFKYRACYRACR